jgi:quinol monooxygenase YgiN
MASAVLVTHRTKPGARDQVRAVWQAHMPAAVSANAGHLAYFYTFDAGDAEVIRAFQVYADGEAAKAFLEADAYRGYVAAVEPLLAGPPEVAVSDVVWAKGLG